MGGVGVNIELFWSGMVALHDAPFEFEAIHDPCH